MNNKLLVRIIYSQSGQTVKKKPTYMGRMPVLNRHWLHIFILQETP